jgi:hypothetical protein
MLSAEFLKRLMRDRVLLALVLALITAVVLLFVLRRDDAFTAGPTQKWGCARGQVEYEKGCYDPSTKTYTHGKRIIKA